MTAVYHRLVFAYLLLVLALGGCASPTATDADQPATALAVTVAPTTTAAPETPQSADNPSAPLVVGTPTVLPSMTPRPTSTARPTNTPPPSPTMIVPEAAGLEGTLLLYASVVDMRTSPNRPPGISTLDDYYAFRTWPPLPFLDPAVFEVFYGERMKMEPIGLFLFDHRPRLSPDGRYILVPGLVSYPEYDVKGTGTWLIDLTAGAARELLPDGVVATWSPASDAITYVKDGALYTLSVAEGAQPQPLFQHPGLWSLYAHWSPDGRYIATVTGVQREITEAAQADLILTYWLVPTNGEPARELTVQEDFAMEYTTGEMSWSPDGQYLLMRNEVFDLNGNQVSPERSAGLAWLPSDNRLLMNGSEGLRIATIAGEELARISDTFADDWVFSRDGARLAYVQGEEGARRVAVYDLASGESQVVYAGAGSPLRWSADDSQLIIGVYRDERPQVIAVRAEPNGDARTVLEDAELIEVVIYPLP